MILLFAVPLAGIASLFAFKYYEQHKRQRILLQQKREQLDDALRSAAQQIRGSCYSLWRQTTEFISSWQRHVADRLARLLRYIARRLEG